MKYAVQIGYKKYMMNSGKFSLQYSVKYNLGVQM